MAMQENRKLSNFSRMIDLPQLEIAFRCNYLQMEQEMRTQNKIIIPKFTGKYTPK